MPKAIILSLIVLFFVSGLKAQETSVLRTDDGSLYFETFGEGLPVLIINGGPGMSSKGFRSLAQPLSKKYQSILFDQRGTGRSDLFMIDSETIKMNKMVDDIETLRNHLGFERWIVFGHSFGGMLASYYVSKHPEHTLGLILSSSGGVDMELFQSLDITGRLTDEEADSLQYWNRRISMGDTTHAARLKRGEFLAPAYLHDKTLVPIIAERLTQGNMTVNELVFQDLRNINFDCKNDLKTYDKPVLIIQGEQDIIPLSISQNTIKLFQNATLVVLKNASHYGWLEQSELYFGAIHTFLQPFTK